MDLKTVRARIRDGTITTLDEFERDIMLIFAYVTLVNGDRQILTCSNATMYNSRGSQLYDMAMEMMKDAEGHIAHLKSVQHHMGR
jgi:bromodomain-containing protein 8